MKKIFLLANISFVLMGASRCSHFDAKGLTPAFIYPDEGIANVRTITNSCPIEVSEKTVVDIKELKGWVCLPPDQIQKIRRAQERTCAKE